MKKKKWTFLFVGLVFLLGIAAIILAMHRPNTTWVEIVRDHEVLYQIDLAQAENQTIEIEYEGRVNTCLLYTSRCV